MVRIIRSLIKLSLHWAAPENARVRLRRTTTLDLDKSALILEAMELATPRNRRFATWQRPLVSRATAQTFLAYVLASAGPSLLVLVATATVGPSGATHEESPGQEAALPCRRPGCLVGSVVHERSPRERAWVKDPRLRNLCRSAGCIRAPPPRPGSVRGPGPRAPSPGWPLAKPSGFLRSSMVWCVIISCRFCRISWSMLRRNPMISSSV